MKTAFVLAAAAGVQAETVGPLQKVLSLLGDLKNKVTAEGEVEKDQFDAYTKWCSATIRDTQHAIEVGESKKEDLEAALQQLTADIGENNANIGKLASGVAANEKDLAAATAVRKDQHADFSATEKELVDTVDALVRAASVLRKAGLGGSAGSGAALKAALAQVSTGLSVVLNAASVDLADKRKLSALLEASQSEDSEDGPSGAPEAAAYESHSTSIIDTLADLKVKAEAELSEARKAEMNNKHNFEMLRQSLTDQVSTQNRDLGSTKANLGSNQEAKGTAEGDLATTSKGLSTDNAHLAEVESQCSTKANEWEERTKARTEELSVLNKAIDILSDDKVTSATGRRLPSQFVQIGARDDVRTRVSELLQKAASRLGSVGLAQLATRTRVGDDPFTKVKGLIGNMIDRLVQTQAEESNKNAWCNEQTAESKAKREKFSNKVETLSTRIDQATAGVANLKEEVATLSKEIAELESTFAEATSLRQKESAEYSAAMADYATSQTALQNAIQTLSEYYSKSALIQKGFGGPIFDGSYKSKTDSSTGIVGILEVALSDFARMEAEGRADENSSSSAYTKLKQDTEVSLAQKRTATKSKEGEIARVTNLINDLKSDRAGSQSELDAVLTYLDKLKAQCEHKPMSFEERAAKRKAEIESLQDALRILEEETAPAFLQKVRRHVQ